MAEIKVSEMQDAQDINDEDLVMIIQNGVNKKAKIEKVRKEEKINHNILNSEKKMIRKLYFKHEPKLIAHRGASEEAPENTIEAFRIAGKQGFWGCETDLMTTSDGVLVVFHDDNVERMTNGTGSLIGKTYEELQNLTIDAGANVSYFKTQKIPLFSEYLSICYEYGMTPVIELKSMTSESIKTFYNTIKQMGFEEKCIVISFKMEWLEQLRGLSSKIKIFALLDFNNDNVDYCTQQNFNINVRYEQLTNDNMMYARDGGIEVAVWDVTSVLKFKQAKEFLVDYITLNSILYTGDHSNETYIETPDGIKIYNKSEMDMMALGERNYTTGLNLFLRRGLNASEKFPKCFNGQITRLVCLNRITVKSNSSITYTIPSGYNMVFYAFKGDNKFTGVYDPWMSGTGTKTEFPANTAYVVPYFRRTDDKAVSDIDIKKIAEGTSITVTY